MDDKVFTGWEIWKAIHYTNPQDLEDNFGFTAETKFKIVEG